MDKKIHQQNYTPVAAFVPSAAVPADVESNLRRWGGRKEECWWKSGPKVDADTTAP
jgi:hypothetical protein